MPVPTPPFSLADYQLIYEILVGEKRYFGGVWHVYDSNGVEIPNPGEILMNGNIGALLDKGNCCVPGVNEWLTEQGVARNLADNLRRLGRQDCRSLVRCEPVPAGSNCEATVKTTARAKAVAFGSEAGSDPVLKGVCHAVTSPDGVGAAGGSGTFAYCSANSSASALGHGLRVGGGRIRTRACSRVVPAGAVAVAGSDVRAFARGIKNPTDEQLLAMAALAIGRRRLTRTTPRV
jgi:hypothetical protein